MFVTAFCVSALLSINAGGFGPLTYHGFPALWPPLPCAGPPVAFIKLLHHFISVFVASILTKKSIPCTIFSVPLPLLQLHELFLHLKVLPKLKDEVKIQWHFLILLQSLAYTIL